ncbi:centrosomal protein of 164 kDa [Hylaeus volcanicus]|uniref:centrosomal protein of 164 kDa n=1 Tax=Hylaeus volcanicus TaxID=313075 RepID=UPI0023B835B7|nr:centrosomal protein of 164 kDa [Hylaeus volcanicus]
MSISQDSAATIVCREVFDETSHPSNEEVLDYARRLGIDPDAEPHLLDLAREGLMAALPKGWLPCFHETSGSWYYYQASTKTTTWEHPLDAVYKELVEQARAGNARQMSVEEDSKTTAKDLESHEEATLPKETSSKDASKATKAIPPPTRIPTKLTPLKKLDKGEGARRKDHHSQERQHFKLDNPLATDRAARDYTNLRFQDPRFYECPKLLDTVPPVSATPTTTPTTPVDELDLKEVLKRSESLSPRHEKDWEQLSSKFSSEENIIDIDKLSVTTLARSEKSDKFDKEKHPSQFGQQKELTLSGGGTMFLKSNKSRDTTPIQETGKLEDFKTVAIPDEIVSVGGDRLKSILREKQSEDDDRPADEERKSVRFDIEKEADIKFTYSGSEDDWESESEEQNVRMSSTMLSKVASILSSQRSSSQSLDDENKEDSESKVEEDTRKSSSSDKAEPSKSNGKVVGRRFVVQNVSESEHRTQMARDSVSRESSLDFVPPSKFDKVKNIDLVSKSETDCSVARSSDSDEFRRNKSRMEKPKKSAIRFSKERQTVDDDTSDLSRIQQELELLRRHNCETMNMNEMKAKLSKEHQEDIEVLKKEFDDKLELTRKELEENFLEQKKLLEENLNDRLEDLKREMAEKEEREIQRLIAEMDEARLENLKKVKAELEICYEKERQEILANLKTELDERKRELLELRNQEMGKLENEHERDLGEEKLAKLSELELTKQHTEKIEALKKELEKEFDELRAELRTQQREKITKITEDHEKCLAEILRDFRMDEGLTRQMYKQRLEEIRSDFSRDAEKKAQKLVEQTVQQESVDIEKMRSENRLLQDKYTALKEKYRKLKGEVRLVVERRIRRKAGYTTASETERSTSTRTRTDRTESSEQNTPVRNTRSSSVTTNAKGHEAQSGSEQPESHRELEDSNPPKVSSEFQKTAVAAVAKTAARFESDDTTTASETNANMMKKKKNFSKKTTSAARASASSNAGNNNNNNPENPVENIRKQLKKLEDLGDQLPSNETAYTLRYPFQDKAPANASSELEFFRHRIHVERDSVRRAQEALRHQENAFQGRQRAWKQRSARATLEQLVQEERELSDMEVSLHRTRSLLGEKVIHLRHLEQTLERVASAKRNENDATCTKNDEMTLSDLSSASSGFSSTDLGTDTFIDKPDHYQESTEIIASLENLNSEIREIWGVLNKRQDNNVPPPPTLMYSYLRWLRLHHLSAQPHNVQGTFGTPNIQSNILSQLTAAQPPTTTTQNIIAQYGPNSGFTTSVGTVEKTSSNLMERTWNLRDWLRQARVENTDLINPGQATL